MSRLNFLDSSFLIAENRETPMHTGGVHLYSYPEGVDKSRYLSGLRDIFLDTSDIRPLFSQRLKSDLLSKANLSISWEQDQAFDMEYHVRHSALPRPGRYRELFALVSRLHSTLLDRSRPLWELHLIEGLEGNQFATYLKTHHCMLDGAASMHLFHAMLSPTDRGRVKHSPLSKTSWDEYRKKMPQPARTAPVSHLDIKALAERLSSQLGSGRNLARALTQYANVWVGGNTALSVPWHAVPRSIISGKVHGSRRFVAQTWPFQRVRAVGKALDGTLNDAVLAMCAGGLRRYLLLSSALPSRPLKAMVPMSLRVSTDLDSANAVGFIVANLATDEADPATRFEIIRDSTKAGKEVFSGMSAGEAELFTQITSSPLLLTKILGLETALPAYNLVISNVPGAREKMYLNGARLDGVYPASIVGNGQLLNITLVSYAGQLDFGIIACRRSLPSVQRLIDCMEEALSELEEVAGITTAES
jgi:WS/DGAT/MGAT family acyltransferase